MDLPSGRKPSGHRYIKVELVLHVQELNFIFGVAWSTALFDFLDFFNVALLSISV